MSKHSTRTEKVTKTEAEWQRELSPTAYHVLRERGTEPAFENDYYALKDKGVYRCGACGNELFSSDAKYESGTGWPSFWGPIRDDAVETEEERGLFGLTRTEVHCNRCGSHLGHLFDDGPPPTGLRYCMNSAALNFVPASERERR